MSTTKVATAPIKVGQIPMDCRSSAREKHGRLRRWLDPCRRCAAIRSILGSTARQQGIPWEVFQAARKPISEAHNRQETPGFAKSIERHALRDK